MNLGQRHVQTIAITQWESSKGGQGMKSQLPCTPAVPATPNKPCHLFPKPRFLHLEGKGLVLTESAWRDLVGIKQGDAQVLCDLERCHLISAWLNDGDGNIGRPGGCTFREPQFTQPLLTSVCRGIGPDHRARHRKR